VRRLFAVAEDYPTLAASESFAKLRDRIASLENQIADRRELYNAAVTDWNTRIAQAPDLVLSRAFSMRPRPLWHASPTDRLEPEVAVSDAAR
jgi:LemA protein